MAEQTFEIEKINQLKSFFNKHWLPSLLLLLIVLGSLGGYKIWSYYTTTSLESASVIYQQILEQEQNIDESADTTDSAKTIIKLAQRIVNDYPSTGYAALAQLIIAKHALTIQKTRLAIDALKWVRQHNSVQEIYTMASIRLAKVLWLDNKHDEALAVLYDSFPSSFAAQVAELQGDIYTSQQDFVKARLAYKAAITASGKSQYLQRKLDDLAVSLDKQ
jgi:predicted negative regulator of RcsB-dependent stress response